MSTSVCLCGARGCRTSVSEILSNAAYTSTPCDADYLWMPIILFTLGQGSCVVWLFYDSTCNCKCYTQQLVGKSPMFLKLCFWIVGWYFFFLHTLMVGLCKCYMWKPVLKNSRSFTLSKIFRRLSLKDLFLPTWLSCDGLKKNVS